MNTMTAEKALENVETGAESNVQEVRRLEEFPIGKIVRQGDIYIHRVEANHPHGTRTLNRQLAMGQTKGSRHILEGEDAQVYFVDTETTGELSFPKHEIYLGTTAPKWALRALLGPLVKVLKRCVVTHPEHAHVSLPEGTYQITHQLDARTLQRVKD